MMPGTYFPSKRLFSSDSRIINYIINKLTEERTDKLIFLNNNLE